MDIRPVEISKLEIFGSNLCVFVRRGEGEQMISACVFPTVTHRGGGVMGWRCFAGDTVWDLQWLHKELKEGVPTIVAHIYLRKIFVLYLEFIFSFNYFTLIKSLFCSYLPIVPILVEGTVHYLDFKAHVTSMGTTAFCSNTPSHLVWA